MVNDGLFESGAAMEPTRVTATDQVGMWSAIVVSALFLSFGVLLVIDFAVPTSTLSFAVCLLAAPFFVALMASIYEHAEASRRIWGLLGLAFAAVYAVLVGITYYLQLTVVGADGAGLSVEASRLLAFAPGSATFAIDMLGYAFMTLATLVAAPVFAGSGPERVIRRWFIVHGLLVVPTVLAPMLMGAPSGAGESGGVGNLILVGWVLVFVPMAVLVALHFRRRLHDAAPLVPGALRPSTS
jgi:hypothetical protein